MSQMMIDIKSCFVAGLLAAAAAVVLKSRYEDVKISSHFSHSPLGRPRIQNRDVNVLLPV